MDTWSGEENVAPPPVALPGSRIGMSSSSLPASPESCSNLCPALGGSLVMFTAKSSAAETQQPSGKPSGSDEERSSVLFGLFFCFIWEKGKKKRKRNRKGYFYPRLVFHNLIQQFFFFAELCQVNAKVHCVLHFNYCPLTHCCLVAPQRPSNCHPATGSSRTSSRAAGGRATTTPRWANLSSTGSPRH